MDHVRWSRRVERKHRELRHERERVEEDASDEALEGNHHLPAVQVHLLEILGRPVEAQASFERAASLTKNEAEREMLRKRASAGRNAEPGSRCSGTSPRTG